MWATLTNRVLALMAMFSFEEGQCEWGSACSGMLTDSTVHVTSNMKTAQKL